MSARCFSYYCIHCGLSRVAYKGMCSFTWDIPECPGHTVVCRENPDALCLGCSLLGAQRDLNFVAGINKIMILAPKSRQSSSKAKQERCTQYTEVMWRKKKRQVKPWSNNCIVLQRYLQSERTLARNLKEIGQSVFLRVRDLLSSNMGNLWNC